jgi:uncharacterized delta-60 repeat protein
MKNVVFKSLSGIIGVISLLSSHTFASPAGMDTSFNTGIPMGFANTINKGYIQADGKIMIQGGQSYMGIPAQKGSLIRLNANGSFDNTFRIKYTPFGWISGVATQADGKMIICDHTYGGLDRIIRLNKDGSVDSSFDGGAVNGFVDRFFIQEDGKILVPGDYTTHNGVSANKLVRLNTDGSRDDTFVI